MAIKQFQGSVWYTDMLYPTTSWVQQSVDVPEMIKQSSSARNLICWDSRSNTQAVNLTKFFDEIYATRWEANTKHTSLELTYVVGQKPDVGQAVLSTWGSFTVNIHWGDYVSVLGSNWGIGEVHMDGQSAYLTRQSIAGKSGRVTFNIPIAMILSNAVPNHPPTFILEDLATGIELDFDRRNISAIPVPNQAIWKSFKLPLSNITQVSLYYNITADNNISATGGSSGGTGEVQGTKISNLDEASSISDTDLLVVAQDDDTNKTYDQTRNIQWSAVKTSIGGAQTWEDVKADRVAGTVYQNTTVNPIVVSATGNQGASASWYMTGHVGATAGSLLEVFKNSFHLYENTTTVVITVPAGHYYQVNHSAGNPSVVAWHELR